MLRFTDYTVVLAETERKWHEHINEIWFQSENYNKNKTKVIICNRREDTNSINLKIG